MADDLVRHDALAPLPADDPRPPAVSDAALRDLHNRLSAFRRTAVPPGHGWDRGVDADALALLLEHWATSYDWRTHERRIRDLPWVLAGPPGARVRLVHQRSEDPEAPVVVLLHGWPDSILRFEKVLPLLPEVDVVVPALPGFPFAAPVPGGGMSAPGIAEAVAGALADLGHTRYVLSAGDVGGDVAEALAAAHPDRVSALHLTDVSQYRFLVDPPTNLTPTEQEYVQRGRAWQAAEGGYMHEQMTKPHTLAVALGDSPAGLAAWLVEKLRSWSDCDGHLEAVFTRDEVLTWVSAYWFSAAIGTSFTPYADTGSRTSGRIVPPAVFTVFPRDLVNAPQVFAERFFDIRSWTEEVSGGHFAAFEQPASYARGVLDAVATARAL